MLANGTKLRLCMNNIKFAFQSMLAISNIYFLELNSFLTENAALV